MNVSSYALTTVDRAKAFLGNDGSGCEDSLIAMLVNIATDTIERHTNRRFKQTTYTGEMYTGENKPNLILNQYPVALSSPFKIERRNGAQNTNSFTELSDQNYYIDANSGIVRFLGNLSSVPQHYRVTYTAGYDFDVNNGEFLDSVGLADLEYACFKLVAAMLYQRKSSGNVTSERIGNYAVTYSGDSISMDAEVTNVLDKYKKPKVG